MEYPDLVMTYEMIKEFFICEYYGKMPVKYKGDWRCSWSMGSG